MNDGIWFLVFIVVYIGLMRFVLPKFGIPT